jgi:cytochrome bd-type quinol oxidase subunit 2
MTFELIVAGFMFVALIFYAVTGDADYGGGMWDLLASGPRAEAQRKAIGSAIAPIWEANHVWLILIIVILFTGFPPAFAAMMTALNIPFTLMLIGIVLRGSAFIFRKYDVKSPEVKWRWSVLFGAASFFTPFIQGLILGALSTGQIRIVDGRVVSGFFAGWVTSFAFACGLFALALFAFLAATYLTVDPATDREVQDDFRLRALWSGSVLVPIAFVVFITSKDGAPAMYHGLTKWWAPLFVVLAALFHAPPASRPNYLGFVIGVGFGRPSERKNSPTGSVFLMVSARVRRDVRCGVVAGGVEPGILTVGYFIIAAVADRGYRDQITLSDVAGKNCWL